LSSWLARPLLKNCGIPQASPDWDPPLVVWQCQDVREPLLTDGVVRPECLLLGLAREMWNLLRTLHRDHLGVIEGIGSVR
jgi:hypothetical protein